MAAQMAVMVNRSLTGKVFMHQSRERKSVLNTYEQEKR